VSLDGFRPSANSVSFPGDHKVTKTANLWFPNQLRTFYDADPQEWWEIRDVRALLDLAVRSALEAAFSRVEEIPEHDWDVRSD